MSQGGSPREHHSGGSLFVPYIDDDGDTETEDLALFTDC